MSSQGHAGMLCDELEKAIESRLTAVYQFGSSFGRGPQAAQVRLLLLVDKLDRLLLDKIAPVVRKARSKQAAIRVYTVDAVLRSADVAPAFALELIDTRKLVRGKDVLGNLPIHSAHLRIRIEQSLRALHRNLVQAYLEIEDDDLALARSLRTAAHRLLYLFEGLLKVSGKNVRAPVDPRLVIETAANAFMQSDLPTWKELREFASFERTLEQEFLRQLYSKVLTSLESAINAVDKLSLAATS